MYEINIIVIIAGVSTDDDGSATDESGDMKHDQLSGASSGSKLAAKVKCLKAWEGELKRREKCLAESEEQVKKMMSRMEEGCDLLPQKEEKNAPPTTTGTTAEIATISCQQEQQKSTDNRLNNNTNNNNNNKNTLDATQYLSSDSFDSEQTSGGQKLFTSGWTQTKVQRLYLKYFRAETFRKNLAYQKQYLTNTLYNNETEMRLTTTTKPHDGKRRRPSLRVVVLAVISIRRMKYLAVKYHRNLNKCTKEYNEQKERGKSHFPLEDNGCSSNDDSSNTSSSKLVGKPHQPPKPLFHVLV